MASIPGMGIPEQLKAAMEQEQSSECYPDEALLERSGVQGSSILDPETHLPNPFRRRWL